MPGFRARGKGERRRISHAHAHSHAQKTSDRHNHIVSTPFIHSHGPKKLIVSCFCILSHNSWSFRPSSPTPLPSLLPDLQWSSSFGTSPGLSSSAAQQRACGGAGATLQGRGGQGAQPSSSSELRSLSGTSWYRNLRAASARRGARGARQRQLGQLPAASWIRSYLGSGFCVSSREAGRLDSAGTNERTTEAKVAVTQQHIVQPTFLATDRRLAARRSS